MLSQTARFLSFVTVNVPVLIHHIFIFLSVDLWVFFALVNKAAAHMGVHTSFWGSLFFKCPEVEFLDLMYGSTILNFSRQLYTVFHRGCTNLHSHQWRTWGPFSPPLCQHLFLGFLIIAMLTSVRSYLTAVRICISLMIGDVRHYFHGPIGYLYVFFRKSICKFFAPVLIGFFGVFWCWVVRVV